MSTATWRSNNKKKMKSIFSFSKWPSTQGGERKKKKTYWTWPISPFIFVVILFISFSLYKRPGVRSGNVEHGRAKLRALFTSTDSRLYLCRWCGGSGCRSSQQLLKTNTNVHARRGSLNLLPDPLRIVWFIWSSKIVETPMRWVLLQLSLPFRWAIPTLFFCFSRLG